MINKNFKIEVANRLETIISTFQLIRLRTLLKARVIIVWDEGKKNRNFEWVIKKRFEVESKKKFEDEIKTHFEG